METQITHGVLIQVKSNYQQTYFNGSEFQYIFSYQITIINKNEFPIQVVSRYWKIMDSYGKLIEVNGLGIVGEQPIILPDSDYEYTSGCNIESELGSMEGHYVCQNILNDQEFQVKIPKFLLCLPTILN